MTINDRLMAINDPGSNTPTFIEIGTLFMRNARSEGCKPPNAYLMTINDHE